MAKKIIRSPRLARKEQQKRTRKLILFSGLAVAVLVALGYGFFRPELRITDIEVIGSSRIPEEAVREKIKQGITGSYLGFIPKAHTLLYPKSALRETLNEAFPVFSTVSISLKSLAALRVSVHEREPQALWCALEKCYLMDETGFVFAEAEPGVEDLYYRLEQAATTTPLGTTALEAERLAALIGFLKRLEELAFDPEKAVFQDEGLLVGLRGGAELLLREGEYEQASSNLEALLSEKTLFPVQGGMPDVSYIDLRYGNKIYFKPR